MASSITNELINAAFRSVLGKSVPYADAPDYPPGRKASDRFGLDEHEEDTVEQRDLKRKIRVKSSIPRRKEGGFLCVKIPVHGVPERCTFEREDKLVHVLAPFFVAAHGTRGGVERFALSEFATPGTMDDIAFDSVQIYLDATGLLDRLPLNRRACALARMCGFESAKFHGDV